MFENPKRGKQARNFTTNVPNILDLKSSSKQIFSKNWCWVPLSDFMVRLFNPFLFCCWGKKRSRLLCTLRYLTEELQLSTLFIFKGLFIIFLHRPPPPHQYRWLESECSILVWIYCVLWKMKFDGWIFLSAPLNAWGVQFCRLLWRQFWATLFKNPSSLEGVAWMKNEMSPNDYSNKTKFLLF